MRIDDTKNMCPHMKSARRRPVALWIRSRRAGHRLFLGDYNGDSRTDLAFYYVGDGNTYIGTSDGTRFNWALASNTAGFGDVLDRNHRFFEGDFDGNGRGDLALPDANAVNNTHSSCTPNRLTPSGGANADTINAVHARPACFTDSGDHAVRLLNGRKRHRLCR